VSQSAIDLALRFTWAQSRVECGVDEQGVSQGVEAVRLIQFGEFGRGSEGRDGSAIAI
jgi:hypothetical protein